MGIPKNQPTRIVARNEDGSRVLIGGLGIFGNGLRWFNTLEMDLANPQFVTAPITPDCPDDFGRTATETR